MDWSKYSFIIRGKIRRKVFISLEKPKTPSQISRLIKTSTPHVSRALKEFIDLKLVECITPELKIGRIYKLTKNGEKLLKELKEIEK